MTVSKRLLILVMVANAALLLVAALGLWQMGRVYEAANYGNINTVPSILALDKATLALGHLRVRIYRHVLNVEDAAKEALAVKIKAAKDELNQALKEYEGLLSDDEDKRLLEADKKALAEYLVDADSVVAVSTQNLHDEALKQLTAGAVKAEAVNEALAAHMKYNVDLGAKSSAQAASTKQIAVWLALGISAAAFLIVTGLGVQIHTSLVTRLAEANGLAERVAGGDLTAG
ncbi:MAG: hypothetical protein EKK46_01525, partial [Rhodocyclaceae bacterium]